MGRMRTQGKSSGATRPAAPLVGVLGLGFVLEVAQAAYDYPEGPASCCAPADEGPCACRARFSGGSDGAAVFVYLWLAFGAVLLGAHGVDRARQSDIPKPAWCEALLARLPQRCGCRDHGAPDERVRLAPSPRSLAAEGVAADARLDAGEAGMPVPGTRVQGYRRSRLGTAGHWYVCLTSALIFVIFLVVLVDAYHLCEVGSIDKQCFYGNYPLTGSFETNAEIFFGLWVFGLLWFLVVFTFADDLPNWFRQPCGLTEAEHVWIWRPESEPENLTASPTWPVRLARRIVARLRTGPRGESQTLPVFRTPPAKLAPQPLRYVELDCRRHLLSSDGLSLPEVEAGPVTFGRLAGAVEPALPTLGSGAVSSGAGAGKPSAGASAPTAAKGDAFVVQGLDEAEAELRLHKLGENRIAFRVDGWPTLLYGEFVSALFFYQVLFYAWWFWDAYLITAAVEFAIVLGAAALSLSIKASNQRTIASLAALHAEVNLCRGGRFSRRDAGALVPGDVLLLEAGAAAPCDMVLLRGTAVVNESGLTGESMPVAKLSRPLDPADTTVYDPTGPHAKHTVFAGTTVLQASEDSVAVCTATNIATSKGKLVALILQPPRMRFKYDEELVVIFGLLGAYAFGVFTFAVVIQFVKGTTAFWVVRLAYGMFTISQVLSPLLPVSLQVGQAMSARRLAREGIFCVNPKRIAICGKVRVACFDKTGTLTKAGLDFVGFREIAEDRADVVLSPLDPADAKTPPRVLRGLACCHALTGLGGDLVGNEVEMQMFRATRWRLEEPPGRPVRVHSTPSAGGGAADALDIVRRFEFDHTRMSMSVLVREVQADGPRRAFAFVKGAPEAVAAMCTRSSADVRQRLLARAQDAAEDGCYVLALAYRDLGTPADVELLSVSRDGAERDLAVLGLLLFRNELKTDSAAVMAQLKAGDVRAVMITGDNAENGRYIATRSGMIHPGAAVVIGEADADGPGVRWRLMNPESAVPKRGSGLNSVSPLHLGTGNDGGKEEGDAGGAAAVEASTIGRSASSHSRLPASLVLPCDTTTLLGAITDTAAANAVRFGVSPRQEGRSGEPATAGGDLSPDQLMYCVGGGLELALTGGAYERLEATDPAALRRLVPGLRIFARTSPLTKQRIVQGFMDLGLVVSMCGDGGNDCGALRTAHAGLALSEAEASVVSPFTSRDRSLRSFVALLREGRGALATSFACFRFLVLYGQLFSLAKILILYYSVIPPAMGYLSVDVLVLITMSYAMTLSRPATALTPERPTSSLLGPQAVASAIGVFAIFVGFYASLMAMMEAEPGYITFPFQCSDGDAWWTLGDNWESTVIFMTFILMLTHAALVFTFGGVHRQPVYRNTLLIALYAALVLIFSVALLTGPHALSDAYHVASRNFNAADTASPVWRTYQAVHRGDAAAMAEHPDCAGGPATDSYEMSPGFRFRMWVLIISSFVLTALWEKIVIHGPVRKLLKRRFPKKSVLLRV